MAAMSALLPIAHRKGAAAETPIAGMRAIAAAGWLQTRKYIEFAFQGRTIHLPYFID
jgi:hypothetical protein